MKYKLKLAIIYFFALLLQTMFYQFAAKVNEFNFPTLRIFELKTIFDDFIPFSEFAIWPYLLYYLFLPAPFLLTQNEKIFSAYLKCFAWISLVSDVIFMIIPVSGPRISLSALNDSISSQLTKILYQVDVNTNCFPSLHSAHSFIIAYFLSLHYGIKSIPASFFNIVAILIVVSTLVTKQHWFVDIVMAAFMSVIILRIYGNKISYQQL